MVNTLGHKLFEEIKDKLDSTNSEAWYINAARGANAKGIQTQEGFVVLKESRIAISIVESFSERLLAKREDLIHSGKIQVINDEYIVMEDLLFSSPSLAAAIVMGRSANGLTEWKDRNGRTLKRFIIRNKINSPVHRGCFLLLSFTFQRYSPCTSKNPFLYEALYSLSLASEKVSLYVSFFSVTPSSSIPNGKH